MPGVKTAISLDENLFNAVKKMACDLNISRSRVFTLALVEFMEKRENEKLLAQLNKAYEEQPTDEENKIVQSMRTSHRKISEQEPW
jgi:metal-responsive CopG/Arc/MetJ family transcriptional regulator